MRAFALTAPDEGLSLLGADGHELAWIDRLADLPPAQSSAPVADDAGLPAFSPEEAEQLLRGIGENLAEIFESPAQ